MTVQPSRLIVRFNRRSLCFLGPRTSIYVLSEFKSRKFPSGVAYNLTHCNMYCSGILHLTCTSIKNMSKYPFSSYRNDLSSCELSMQTLLSGGWMSYTFWPFIPTLFALRKVMLHEFFKSSDGWSTFMFDRSKATWRIFFHPLVGIGSCGCVSCCLWDW